METRVKELAILDSVERQLMQLAEISGNDVQNLIEQVRFQASLYFLTDEATKNAEVDATMRMVLARLQRGERLSSYEIGKHIYPYIRLLRERGCKGIAVEKKYIAKAKRTFTFYYLEK